MNLNSHQEGYVSLITAVLISLLLLLVTGSLIGVQIITLKDASNSEQSQRAYYAAESGAEDALAKVDTQAVVANQTNCPSKATSNTNLLAGRPGEIGWTCQSITFSDSPTGKLTKPDSAVTIDPYGVSGYNVIVLRWDQSTGSKPIGYYNAPALLGAGTYPSNWGQHALPLELSITQYPTGKFTSPSVQTHNMVILPSAGGFIAHCAIGGGCAIDGKNPFVGTCSNNGTPDDSVSATNAIYHCRVQFSVQKTSSYLFRLRSLYEADGSNGFIGSGQYVMNFYNVANPKIPAVPPVLIVPEKTVTIDVTGKAGNSFRRVLYKQPLGPQAQGDLNYALFADGDLCKDYTVVGGKATGGCHP
jgi:hypothetical protein